MPRRLDDASVKIPAKLPGLSRWIWKTGSLRRGRASVLLQVAVVNLGLLNAAFGTVPLELDQWLLWVALASMVLLFSELRKLASRAWGR